MPADFKDFLMKGNLVTLAVAFGIGVAFATVVRSFVENIITPIIAAIGGQPDFSAPDLTVHGSVLRYGLFLNALIAFIVVAAILFFLVVRPYNRLSARYSKEDPSTKECPECTSRIAQAARRCPECAAQLLPPSEEVAAAMRLPGRPFDPCIERQAVVDKYQTVAFDANRYSVPRPWAFRAVTVKGYVDRVVVVAGGQAVAEHPRCYDHSQQVLDPLHYLAALERRPAALDHASVYRDWKPTAAFAASRRELEERYGVPAGTRQFIRVLQLLAEHPQERVERAIESCRAGHAISAEAIVQRARALAASCSRSFGGAAVTSRALIHI